MFVEKFKEGENFTLGETYYAVASFISEDGKESLPSEEVTFVPLETSKTKEHMKIGIFLQLKILFYTLLAYIIN